MQSLAHRNARAGSAALCLTALLLAPCFALRDSPSGDAAQSDRKHTLAEPEGLIHLDVVVRSPSGMPVLGLKATDFAVLDNGEPRKVLSFHGYGEAGEPPPAITVVLDTLKAPEDVAAEEREALTKFLLQEGGHLPQPVSLLLLNDHGLWRVGGPSGDGVALVDGLNRKHLTPYETPMPGSVRQQSPPANTGTAFHPYTADGPPGEAGLRALGTIATAARRNPGRKILIWIGPGWNIGSGVNPEERTGVDREKKAAFDKIVWFSTLLRLARMSLDSWTPVPPPEQALIKTGTSRAMEEKPESLPDLPADFPANVLRPVTSPRGLSPIDHDRVIELNRQVLAIESGGRALEGGEAAGAMDACIREAHAAYTLTFNPSPAHNADEYHQLKVVMREPELTAHTNTGYYDEPYYSDEPDAGIRKVTVAELDQALKNAAGTSDGDLARQLEGMDLTEQASLARIDAWTAELHGRKAREALLAMADASAFLAPPPDDIVNDPPPSVDAQRKIVALAAEYLNRTLPRLPDFFARRTATNYVEIPGHFDSGQLVDAEPLHVVDESRTTVVFRNGAEEVNGKLLEREHQKGALSTYGTFGPVLTVAATALSRGVAWSRWEKDPGGERRAVFRYSVPGAASQSETGGCCLPEGEGSTAFSNLTPYHGEIAIDPENGAILRLAIEADLNEYVPADRADIMVAYGPVKIGDKTYICPLHSVSLLRLRSLNTRTEWDTQNFLMWGPYATRLNDFRFDDYHLFRAKVRILPGVAPVAPQ